VHTHNYSDSYNYSIVIGLQIMMVQIRVKTMACNTMYNYYFKYPIKVGVE